MKNWLIPTVREIPGKDSCWSTGITWFFRSLSTVLIPVQAAYLPVNGLEQLVKTIGRVQRRLNKNLCIEGKLLTMVDARTNYARDISQLVIDTYSNQIGVFQTCIPLSVRAAEISAEGSRIYQYDPKGKAANAYRTLTEEVLDRG